MDETVFDNHLKSAYRQITSYLYTICMYFFNDKSIPATYVGLQVYRLYVKINYTRNTYYSQDDQNLSKHAWEVLSKENIISRYNMHLKYLKQYNTFFVSLN